ncbi:metallophosphoesterase [Paenibacillus faecalis]|uniref:metallophosphoesterase n=1 Tax=Paenibacillus faecalis TaxID=2079532 RepID=UPI000D0EC867|nr:metallophosphoesterase [Paenibacillus faecalis]
MKNSSDPLLSSKNNQTGDEPPKTLTRRQFLKLGTSALIGTALVAGGYASLYEPNTLEVVRMTLYQERLPEAFDGTKIAHFSDFHLGFQTDAEDVRRIVSAINWERPDLVCFTGDMVDGSADALAGAVDSFAALKAPLGVLSILGNHDFDDVNRLVQLQQKAGFTVLRNEHVMLRRNGGSMAVAGLDDQLLGFPDLDKALKGVPENTYTLLMMHEPDYADWVIRHHVDLQLSGHSHGGQVRLPWIGEVITPPGSKNYIKGLYRIEGSRLLLYVNRGIGTTGLPFRFLCKPELTMLTLRKKRI